MSDPATLATPHLRVARPTDDLDAVVRFYRDGLGFEIIGSFTNHDGFDGVMLGHAGVGYHPEFTRKAGHAAGKAPTPDNLLVFYLPDAGVWAEAVQRMEAAADHAVRIHEDLEVRGRRWCSEWRRPGTRRCQHSIRIGIGRARRSRTSTATASCFRTQRGRGDPT